MSQMTEREGSARKAFADRLARFAYGDKKPSPRDSPRSSKPPSGPPSPVTPVRRSRTLASANTDKKRSRRDEDVKEEAPESTAGPSQTRGRDIIVDPTQEEPERSVSATKKAKKIARPYAGPEVYAHLKNTPDHLAVGLGIIFCGINPGKKSAATGTHFAHPTNKFWRALHISGLTPRLYAPSECHLLPEELNYGLTNLCGRPTAEQSELSTLEMRLNVHPFTLKLIQLRPRVVCFVGKKIWDVFEALAGKTATLCAPPPDSAIKTEAADDADIGHVKAGEISRSSSPLTDVEADIKPTLPTVPTTPLRSNPATIKASPISKRKSPAKVPFDWYVPRSLRLPLPPNEDGSDGGYCYFWVTPSTSGLERTPLAEQADIFAALRVFSESLRDGARLPDQEYRDINTDGLGQTSEKIRADAVAKGINVPLSVHL